MKSLKSRLRRQDAPGPTSSGAAAAASAVSPAARARPGSLRSLPAESPSARKRALLPWLLSAPGSAAAATPPPSLGPGLRVCMETLGTLPSAASGPRGTPATPLSSGPRSAWFGDQITPSSIRCASVVPQHLPSKLRGLSRSPRMFCPGLAPRGPWRASLRPPGCGWGWKFAPRVQVGDSGPSVNPRLGALSGTGLGRRLLLAAVCLSLGKFDFSVRQMDAGIVGRTEPHWVVALEVVKLGR